MFWEKKMVVNPAVIEDNDLRPGALGSSLLNASEQQNWTIFVLYVVTGFELPQSSS